MGEKGKERKYYNVWWIDTKRSAVRRCLSRTRMASSVLMALWVSPSVATAAPFNRKKKKRIVIISQKQHEEANVLTTSFFFCALTFFFFMSLCARTLTSKKTEVCYQCRFPSQKEMYVKSVCTALPKHSLYFLSLHSLDFLVTLFFFFVLWRAEKENIKIKKKVNFLHLGGVSYQALSQ